MPSKELKNPIEIKEEKEEFGTIRNQLNENICPFIYYGCVVSINTITQKEFCFNKNYERCTTYIEKTKKDGGLLMSKWDKKVMDDLNKPVFINGINVSLKIKYNLLEEISKLLVSKNFKIKSCKICPFEQLCGYTSGMTDYDLCSTIKEMLIIIDRDNIHPKVERKNEGNKNNESLKGLLVEVITPLNDIINKYEYENNPEQKAEKMKDLLNRIMRELK